MSYSPASSVGKDGETAPSFTTVIAGKDATGKTYRVLVDTSGRLQIDSLAGLEVPGHDYIELTYVAAGNGAGEIETVTYKTGGALGTTVATLTLAYNADDELSSVVKT